MKMSNKTFDSLKWICLLALPGLSTFISMVFPLWGIPYADEIAQTITALATLIGGCLGVSSMNYYKQSSIEIPEDEVEVDHNEEGEG